MKEVYKLLEPKNYIKLERSDFKGVCLNYDECVLITQKFVDMELELRKLKSNAVS